MTISKIFIPNFVNVLKNERYKTHQTGFLLSPWKAPGVGLLGAGGAHGVKIFFFKHGHVAYQIDGDDTQNKMQGNFSSKGHTGDLGVRSKAQILLNFGYHDNFIFLYQTVCVFLQIKDRKHIEQNFHSAARVMGFQGAGGSQKL